jgi:hypothetical protein
MFFTGEGYIATVNGVAANEVKDFVVLITRGSESSPTSRNIVEKIFDLPYGLVGFLATCGILNRLLTVI